MKKKILIGIVIAAVAGGIAFVLLKGQGKLNTIDTDENDPVITLRCEEFATGELSEMGDYLQYVDSATAADGTDLSDSVEVVEQKTDEDDVYELVYSVEDKDGRSAQATMIVHTGCVYFGEYDESVGKGGVSSTSQDDSIVEEGVGTGTTATRTAEFYPENYNNSSDEALAAARAYAATIDGKYRIFSVPADDGQTASGYVVIRIVE